jgi:cytochrome c oxidase assembly protein subunit 11
MAETRNNQRRQIALLSLLALGMFGFAFALVPLYEVFCEVTGLNGKTAGRAAIDPPVTIPQDSDRKVTIQFLAHVNKGMPVEFRPAESSLQVRIGEIYTTDYFARNRAAQAVTGQAIPSVAPGNAAEYLRKVECFCFSEQRLEEGAEAWMPLRFYVDDGLPEEIRTISLSYTLYKAPAVQDTSPVTMLSSNRQ